MRPPESRANRAARRHSGRVRNTAPITPPPGWPDGQTLINALDANAVATALLAETKPETVRTLLTRMEGQARRQVLNAHNIPSAKVSLRAADQVLALMSADKKPAESALLRALCRPAAELFDETIVHKAQLTALRLTQADLAMQLITHSAGVYRGLYAWYRWGDEEYEELALIACVGAQYTHAPLAASYLAAIRPDVAERYAALRERFPALPEIAIGRLTSTNAVARYAAARADRKLPVTAVEVRGLLAEDSKVRLAELNHTRRDRERVSIRRDPPTTEPTTVERTAPIRPVVFGKAGERRAGASTNGEAWSSTARTAPASPDVATWAAAIAVTRQLNENLVAGIAPGPEELRELGILTQQMRVMSELLSIVVNRPVAATRADIDQALTLALADPTLTKRLGGVPVTCGDAADRLAELRRESRTRPASTVTPRLASAGPTAPSVPSQREATTAELDLSDLDAMLRGETGAQITAIAGPRQRPQRSATSEPHPVGDSETEADPQPTHAPEPRVEDGLSSRERSMLAAARYARVADGTLARAFADLTAESDERSLPVVCAALPMALLDPTNGASSILDLDHDRLPGQALRRFSGLLQEWAQHNTSMYDGGLRQIDAHRRRLDDVVLHAGDILDAAPTRTFKYDKATKVYRHWLGPEGRLYPLLRSVAEHGDTERVRLLAEECRRVGAGRAVDDTATDQLGSRTKIVAKARQSLVDFFDEVLDLADDYLDATDTVEQTARGDRTSAWLHGQLAAVREFALAEAEHLRSEADRLAHPAMTTAVLRAVDMAVLAEADTGPEPTLEVALRRNKLHAKASR
ncbi:hypothetical protein [Stackebrandtia soli]|uniref:hypothetical protein n=1 Tax=Stackebrandtia soli TaxID=1892856 RepID=UPI0039EC35C8